jgi:hydrogenase maturation protein HypF
MAGLPYDRAATSMASFPMCKNCAKEYGDPADRRYHAQPVACPACGPRMIVRDGAGAPVAEDWIAVWARSVASGDIVAIKGVGGIHLACNAFDASALARLRTRKHRENKPFAVMAGSLEWVRDACCLSSTEEAALNSAMRPIVILKVKRPFAALPFLAPGLDTLGVMLPYSPLHQILMTTAGVPIVCTSANYSSEPMITGNAEAVEKLRGMADYFLLHDRDIVNRCEDSVVFCAGDKTFIVRPGRGFCPAYFPAPAGAPCIAFGSDMKNTFAVSHEETVFLSQYIGDLAHPGAQEIFRRSLENQLRFQGISPAFVVHDLHPDYYSTGLALDFAKERNIPALAVQHHHAHAAAGYAEHGLTGRAIGFAFDGTGYGTDGTLWGGEVLLFDLTGFERRFHFAPVVLPGGDNAVTHPEYMLIACLMQAGLFERAKRHIAFSEKGKEVAEAIDAGLFGHVTSSLGRLFDAVAFLLGACSVQTYDAEAAIRLEAMADAGAEGSLPFAIHEGKIIGDGIFQRLLDGLDNGVSSRILAGMFHNTLADIVCECGARISMETGPLPWVCAGGVFQNRLLVQKLLSHPRLPRDNVFFCSYPNDSGIALGQAAVASALRRK